MLKFMKFHKIVDFILISFITHSKAKAKFEWFISIAILIIVKLSVSNRNILMYYVYNYKCNQIFCVLMHRYYSIIIKGCLN